MSDKTAIQNEKYWREIIAQEIREYDWETHRCFGHGCPRCDISSALQSVARLVERKEPWEAA
jgi:hypothetical protein